MRKLRRFSLDEIDHMGKDKEHMDCPTTINSIRSTL